MTSLTENVPETTGINYVHLSLMVQTEVCKNAYLSCSRKTFTRINDRKTLTDK